MILGKLFGHFLRCIPSKKREDIIKPESSSSYSRPFESHFFDPSSYQCPNDKPFILLEFDNTVFELISDYRNFSENTDIMFDIFKSIYKKNVRTLFRIENIDKISLLSDIIIKNADKLIKNNKGRSISMKNII